MGKDIFHTIKDEYTVFGDTILVYNGDKEDLIIPSVIDGQPIRAIGDGAFISCNNTRRIQISEGIKSIGQQAFKNCRKLVSLTVPASVNDCDILAFLGLDEMNMLQVVRKVSRENYNRIKENNIEMDNHVILMANPHSEIEDLNCIYEGLKRTVKFAEGISLNMGRLYLDFSKEFEQKKQTFDSDAKFEYSLPEKWTSFDLKRGMERVHEKQAFLQKIRENVSEPFSAESEEMDDKYERLGNARKIENTAIVFMDDNETKILGDEVTISLQIRWGKWYWQSSKRIVFEGKDYYVYRRQYLTSDEKTPFARREVCIFDENGIVSDKKIIGAIYGKYYLLSMFG